MKKKSKFYKNFFLIAGLWNLLAGIPCWIGTVFLTEFFLEIFKMPIPGSLFPYHTMFFFIIMFGVGYIIVSKDITKNHGIVWIGMIAKIGFFVISLFTYLINEANILLAGFGLVDFIFAVLFIDFLRKRKNIS
jgi:hypothetical protein